MSERREEDAYHWKMWAAKHEYEELKEVFGWSQALLRKKTKEEWTDKQRNVARKLGTGRILGAEETLRHWLVE